MTGRRRGAPQPRATRRGRSTNTRKAPQPIASNRVLRSRAATPVETQPFQHIPLALPDQTPQQTALAPVVPSQQTPQQIALAPVLPSQQTAPLTRPMRGPDEYRVERFADDAKLMADGSNYFVWRDLQEMILHGHRWYGYVDGSAIQPPLSDPDAYASWHQIDQLTRAQLSFNMQTSLYNELRVGIKSAAQLWNRVNKRFGQENVTIQNKASLQLRSKRIQEGERFRDHIITLRKYRAQCIDAGLDISAKEWHAIVLQSISDHPKWEAMSVFGTMVPDPETLIASLELHEVRTPVVHDTALPATANPPVPQTNAYQQRNRSRNSTRTPCPNCGRGYHTVDKCWAPGGGAVDKRPPNYRIPADMIDKARAQIDKELAQIAVERKILEEQKAKMATQLTVPRIETVQLAQVKTYRQYSILTCSEGAASKC